MSNLSTCNAMKRIQCDNGSLKYAVYLKFAIDVISITECKLKLQLSSLKTFLLNLKMMVVHTEISKLRFSNEIVFQDDNLKDVEIWPIEFETRPMRFNWFLAGERFQED